MGTILWLVQRFSSLIILSYILLIFINYFIKPYDVDAQVWFSDINSIQMKIFTSLFLIVMVLHALQGLKAVEDENATALHGVPTMFIAELALSNFKEYDL